MNKSKLIDQENRDTRRKKIPKQSHSPEKLKTVLGDSNVQQQGASSSKLEKKELQEQPQFEEKKRIRFLHHEESLRPLEGLRLDVPQTGIVEKRSTSMTQLKLHEDDIVNLFDQRPRTEYPPTEGLLGTKENQKFEQTFDKEFALEIPRHRHRIEDKKGRPIKLETNHFAISVSKMLEDIYQYDVTIEPDRPKKMMPFIMEQFRKKHFPNRFPAFDGMKNLFAPRPLISAIRNDEIDVIMPDEGNSKKYKVTMKFNGKIVSMSSLQDYFQASLQKRDRLPPQEVLQVLDIVLKSASSLKFISVGRSYFSLPHDGRRIPLGDGMEMYYGFYQSAIVAWKPFLNVDVVHKAFPQRLDGINLILELLKCDKRTLESPLRSFELGKVERFLIKLKVQFMIPKNQASKRVMRCNGLDLPANQATFIYQGDIMTVAAYFEREKGYRLKFPNMPCLWVGSVNRENKILIPIEICTVLEGQAVNRKTTAEQTSAMIRNAAKNTDVRKEKILSAVRNSNYNKNPVVREFGLEVCENFEKISGRVLPAPAIQYENKVERPARGAWRYQQLYNRSALRKWTILNLDHRTKESCLYDFAKTIEKEGKRLGMTIDPPGRFLMDVDYQNLSRSIKDKLSRRNYDLVFVVLPDNSEDYYSIVKQQAELEVGRVTQCVKSRTVLHAKPTTICSMLLKVNSKLNGINHILQSTPPCLLRPCMIMGADVTHPSPDSRNIPSVAAVTASHDPTAFKYNVCWRLQPPNQEIIGDLENIVVTQLKYFYDRNNGMKPERLIFFRDGVSEGQFKYVMNMEVAAIRRACATMNGEYKPAITFLVVQKRHHTRFFPVNARDSEDRNKNVPAGTCVDEIITNPTATDFYLVSHASIQGVAKPTKYVVLWDDADMDENELEELTYHLCHMFSRCTRSVSYPSPTYYAHLAAARSKVYIQTRKIDLNNLKKEEENTQIRNLIIENNPMFFV